MLQSKSIKIGRTAMVFAKNIEITFPAIRDRQTYVCRRVISLEVESSYETLTDKATFRLGRAIKGMNLEQVRDTFRRGDKVLIKAGYNGVLETEFTGYIVNVMDEKHLEFECQDEMFKLKTVEVNFNRRSCALKDLLKVVAPGYDVDAPEADLGHVRFTRKMASEVLQEVKDKYGIYSYFRDGVLVCGKINQGSSVRYQLNYDVDRNIKSHDLTYRRAEDIRARVRCSSILDNGTKIEVTVGDPDGEINNIELFGITSKADLKVKAEAKLALMKVDGLEGTVSLFGVPRVRFGDEVLLNSTLHPERSGAYYIKSTIYNYVTGQGITRKVDIGGKAA